MSFVLSTSFENITAYHKVSGPWECDSFHACSRLFARGLRAKRLRALSFCMEKPVVPVVNQMERTFPPEIFRKKKKEYLLRYYSFLVFTGMIKKILFHLRRFTSSMLLGELNARFAPGKHGVRVYLPKKRLQLSVIERGRFYRS